MERKEDQLKLLLKQFQRVISRLEQVFCTLSEKRCAVGFLRESIHNKLNQRRMWMQHTYICQKQMILASHLVAWILPCKSLSCKSGTIVVKGVLSFCPTCPISGSVCFSYPKALFLAPPSKLPTMSYLYK